jgi:hypothetical protein
MKLSFYNKDTLVHEMTFDSQGDKDVHHVAHETSKHHTFDRWVLEYPSGMTYRWFSPFAKNPEPIRWGKILREVAA